jgi:flagellar biosynthesis/type III secretory pathway chaperone
MKQARTRDQRLAKKQYSLNDYSSYSKNFGFGKSFLPFEYETKEEKKEKARIRNEYSRQINERNSVIIDEQRRSHDIFNNINSLSRNYSNNVLYHSNNTIDSSKRNKV